jgi:hypothetical protein
MPTRSRRAAVLRFALVAAVLPLAGCRNPSERAADEILAKNALVRGGLDAWRGVRSMTLSGKLEAGVGRDPLKLAQSYQRTPAEAKAQARRALLHKSEEPAQVRLPFLMELRRPRQLRLEVDFQGQKALQVYDGARGWKLRPFLGRREVEPFTEEELRLASLQTELDGPLIDAAAKGSTVRLVGTNKLEGHDAYDLEVKLATGQTRHVWVDAKTFLDLRVDGERRLDGTVHKVFTWFRDWRPVNGLLVAHTLETRVEGGAPGSEKIVVEKITLNPELADARFAKPE